jgi:hypothetical protein
MFCSSASCESAMIGSCRLLLTAFLQSRISEPASVWADWLIFWGAEDLLNERRRPDQDPSVGRWLLERVLQSLDRTRKNPNRYLVRRRGRTFRLDSVTVCREVVVLR